MRCDFRGASAPLRAVIRVQNGDGPTMNLILTQADIGELQAFALQNFRGTEGELLRRWLEGKMRAQMVAQNAAKHVQEQAANGNGAAKELPGIPKGAAKAEETPAKRGPGRPAKAKSA